MKIPFSKPYISGAELENLRGVFASGKLSGNGEWTKQCQTWLVEHEGARKALLTHSGTGALEMAALLLDLQPGDEVIMPSFTFVSTANAFVLRGARPVFVEIRSDTLNLDEKKVAAAITPRTRAIVPVHYAGVSCAMEPLTELARINNIYLIADAAQSIDTKYRDRPAASWGHLSALSFHETKNVGCGEGGALVINDERFAARAEVLWEKGTDRSRFLRGENDKYTWVDMGSSFLPSEITAAILFEQLKVAHLIKQKRLMVWQAYHRGLESLEQAGLVTRPKIPADCEHNAHIYYFLLAPEFSREKLFGFLRDRGIQAVSHYVPLHQSTAGKRFGRIASALPLTEQVGEQLVRLPLWADMPYADEVVSTLDKFFAGQAKS